MDLGLGLLSAGSLKGIKIQKFDIAKMTQAEIVDYSLQDEDFDFAAPNPGVMASLTQIRDHLKTASSPLEVLDVEQFIAKGTAGWIFLCTKKNTQQRVALKLIRMTQARTGIKEWCISKVLKEQNIPNVVLTEETVFVLDRSEAPPVIQEMLEHAGPVPYYFATVQELMPWGTLEDLAKHGQLSPEIMLGTIADVASTLAHMHTQGIQHRDLKPENVMVRMLDAEVVSADLCDFGRCELGDNSKGRLDDIRRLGVMFFSLATGEGWTANSLLHQKHRDLVDRLAAAVQHTDNATIQRLPEVLKQILGGELDMQQIANLMGELSDEYAE